MGRPTEQLEDRIMIHQLKNHHRSMARDIVAGGLRNHQIAKTYGMSESQISIIVNSPLFQAECARLEEMIEDETVGAKQRLLALAPQATKVLAENLYDDSVDMEVRRLKTKSAIDILDRIIPKKEGVKAGTINIQQNIDARKMSTEDLRDEVFDLIRDEDDE
jgi:hypothetical protein